MPIFDAGPAWFCLLSPPPPPPPPTTTHSIGCSGDCYRQWHTAAAGETRIGKVQTGLSPDIAYRYLISHYFCQLSIIRVHFINRRIFFSIVRLSAAREHCHASLSTRCSQCHCDTCFAFAYYLCYFEAETEFLTYFLMQNCAENDPQSSMSLANHPCYSKQALSSSA